MLLLATAFLFSTLAAAPHNTDGCLPAEIKPSDIVSAQMVKQGVMKTITVAQKLKELRARCSRGKLVDAAGREIRFYHLVGCWGNPPEDYQEILDRQAKELANLRRRYRVIEMTCNTSGQPLIQISSNRHQPDR